MTTLLTRADDELLQFVASLELGRAQDIPLDSSSFIRSRYLDGEPAGFAVNGCLCTFLGGVGGQEQSDVLDSTLLANLAATKKFSRSVDPGNWTKAFLEVLAKIGWIVQTTQSAAEDADGSLLTPKYFVEKLFNGGERDILLASVSALDQLARQHGLPGPQNRVWFNFPSNPFGSWNLQLGATRSDAGTPTMALVSASWTALPRIQTYLSFSFADMPAKLRLSRQTLSLNEEVYGRLREEVRKRLGKLIAEDITQLA